MTIDKTEGATKQCKKNYRVVLTKPLAHTIETNTRLKLESNRKHFKSFPIDFMTLNTIKTQIITYLETHDVTMKAMETLQKCQCSHMAILATLVRVVIREQMVN